MRQLIIVLLATFSLKSVCYSQVDTLQRDQSNSYHKHFREKSSSILIGLHLQETKDQSDKNYKRKYLELGIHKTLLTDYAVFTHGLSVEISPEKHSILGVKYGGWTNYAFFSLGLNGIYYTNFTHGNFIIRPEFGLGVDRFRLAFGYNISTFSNEQFSDIKNAKRQFILNVLLNRKSIKLD